MKVVPRGCESFMLRPKLPPSDSLRVLTGSPSRSSSKSKKKIIAKTNKLFRNDPVHLSPGSDGTASTYVSTSDSEMEEFIEKNRLTESVANDAEDSLCNASADTRWVSNQTKGKNKKVAFLKPKSVLNQKDLQDQKSYSRDNNASTDIIGRNSKTGVTTDSKQKSKPHVAIPPPNMAHYACIPSFCLDLPDASNRVSSSKESVAQHLWRSLQVNNNFQMQQLSQDGLDTKHQGDDTISMLFFGPPPIVDHFLFPNMDSHDVKIHPLVERWIIYVPNSSPEDHTSDSDLNDFPQYAHRQFLSDFETIIQSKTESYGSKEHDDNRDHDLKFKLAHHHAMYLLQKYGHADLALSTLRDFLLPRLIKAIINREKKQSNSPTVWRITSLVRFTRRNIATLHMLQGDFVSARDNLWQITRCRSNDLIAHVFLGMSLCAIGNFEDAIRIYLKTLVLLQRQPELDVTPNHCKEGTVMSICSKLRRNKHKFAVGKVLNNMGFAFFQGSDYKKAKQTFERALRVLCCEEFDSLDLTIYAKHMESSDSNDEDDGDSDQVKQPKKTKFESYLVYNGNYIPSAFGQDVTIAFCNLAHSHIKLKEYESAIFTLGTALMVQQNLPEKDITLIFSILSCLGYLCGKVGENDKALQTYSQLFRMLDEDTEADPRDIESKKIHTLSHLSYLHLMKKDYANGLVTLTRLMTYQESLLGRDHPDTLKTRTSVDKLEEIVTKTQASAKFEL